MTEDEIRALFANPIATEKELRDLWWEHPDLCIQHPNCSMEWWWSGAAYWPAEARRSSLFGLLQLEDPARWERTVQVSLLRWLKDRYLDDLYEPDQMGQRLTADVLEFLMGTIEDLDALHRAKIKDAISSRRQFARGEISYEAFRDGMVTIMDPMIWRQLKGFEPMRPYLWILEATAEPDPIKAIELIDGRASLWIWERFCFYWNQRHPPIYQSEETVGSLPQPSPVSEAAIPTITAARIREILSPGFWRRIGREDVMGEALDFARAVVKNSRFDYLCRVEEDEEPALGIGLRSLVETFIPGTGWANEVNRDRLEFLEVQFLEVSFDGAYLFPSLNLNSFQQQFVPLILMVVDYRYLTVLRDPQALALERNVRDRLRRFFDQENERNRLEMNRLQDWSKSIEFPVEYASGGLLAVANALRDPFSSLSRFMDPDYDFARVYAQCAFDFLYGDEE